MFITVALLLFPSSASTLPCWSAASNIVLVGSSPTLRYLLNCGFLSIKPTNLSNRDGYFPYELTQGITQMQTVLGLSKTGEEGVLEMLVIKEGKCFISKEDLLSLHKSYIENFHFSSEVQKSSVSSQYRINVFPVIILILVILSTPSWKTFSRSSTSCFYEHNVILSVFCCQWFS